MRHTRHIRYNVNVLVPQNPHTQRGNGKWAPDVYSVSAHTCSVFLVPLHTAWDMFWGTWVTPTLYFHHIAGEIPASVCAIHHLLSHSTCDSAQLWKSSIKRLVQNQWPAEWWPNSQVCRRSICTGVIWKTWRANNFPREFYNHQLNNSANIEIVKLYGHAQIHSLVPVLLPSCTE